MWHTFVSFSCTYVLGIFFFYFSFAFCSVLRPRSTRQINTVRLVREPSIHTKWWVYVSSDALRLMDGLELLQILGIEGDELAVLVDARRRDGLCEDGRVARDWDNI